MVLVGRRGHARRRRFLPRRGPPQRNDQIQRIPRSAGGGGSGVAGTSSSPGMRSGGAARHSGGRDSSGVYRSARRIWYEQEDGGRVVRVCCRTAHAVKTAARSAFCGGRPQNGFGKNSTPGIKTANSLSRRKSGGHAGHNSRSDTELTIF